MSEQKDFPAAHGEAVALRRELAPAAKIEEGKDAACARLQHQFYEQQATLLSQIEHWKKVCAEYRIDAERLRRWRRVRQRIAPDGSLRHLILVVIRAVFERRSQNSGEGVREARLLLRCEHPNLSTGAMVSGFCCVQGWAWPMVSVDRIEILVDEAHIGNAFYGFVRPDVIHSRAERGNDPHLGFAFRLDTSNLSAGIHQLKIVAIDKNGETTSVEGSIEVIPQQKNQQASFGGPHNDSRSITTNSTANLDRHVAATVTSADAAHLEGSE
jgi:hypothetical protein